MEQGVGAGDLPELIEHRLLESAMSPSVSLFCGCHIVAEYNGLTISYPPVWIITSMTRSETPAFFKSMMSDVVR